MRRSATKNSRGRTKRASVPLSIACAATRIKAAMNKRSLLAAVAFISALALTSTPHAAEKRMAHLSVYIRTIPHSSQRYDTSGDWLLQGGHIVVKVSRLSRRDFELLVALHELVKAYLCQRDRISQKAVDAWDTGPGKDLDEPVPKAHGGRGGPSRGSRGSTPPSG